MNGCIEVYTGRMVNPAEPKITDVSIIDIGHALAHLTRYTGHTQSRRGVYSVGQHCNILFDYARDRGKPPATCLKALLHDAGEAYTGEIASPLKRLCPDLVKAERGMTTLTYRLTGLVDDDEDTAFVHEIDKRIVRDERASLMGRTDNAWVTDSLEPLGLGRIAPAPADEVYQGFMSRYAMAAEAHLGRPVYMAPFWGATVSWSDVPDAKINDVVECDVLGGVAQVCVRTDDGMLARDLEGGLFPRPKTRWMNGSFILVGKR